MNNNFEIFKKDLLKDGYCVIRTLIPQDLIQDLKVAIKRQCYFLAKRNNIEIDSNCNLDEIFNLLCSYDRSLGSVIFDNVRNLPEFLSLVSCKPVRNAAMSLLDSNVLFSPSNSNTFRIDRRGEDEQLLNWHQDFTYEFLSNPSLTFWVPIFEVSEELGPPIIIAGSHKDLKETKFTHQKNMHGREKILPIISNEELDFNESKVVTDTFSPGDVLVMSTILVHKSGLNKSATKNRWTAQIRVGTFDNEDFAKRNWTYETSSTFELFKKFRPKLTKYPSNNKFK